MNPSWFKYPTLRKYIITGYYNHGSWRPNWEHWCVHGIFYISISFTYEIEFYLLIHISRHHYKYFFKTILVATKNKVKGFKCCANNDFFLRIHHSLQNPQTLYKSIKQHSLCVSFIKNFIKILSTSILTYFFVDPWDDNWAMLNNASQCINSRLNKTIF